MTCVIYRRNKHGFSLVEVVLALGIFTFAGFALVGLLNVGIQSGRDSKEQLQAANIAEFLCSTRRAAPMQNVSSVQPNFPLPVLYPSANNLSNPVYLTWDGTTTTLASGNARFGLVYNIIAPSTYTAKVNPGYSTVYLCLYWPAAAPLNSPSSHFEITSHFALP